MLGIATFMSVPIVLHLLHHVHEGLEKLSPAWLLGRRVTKRKEKISDFRLFPFLKFMSRARRQSQDARGLRGKGLNENEERVPSPKKKGKKKEAQFAAEKYIYQRACFQV